MAGTAIATVADAGRDHLIHLAEAARDYAEAGVAANTARAYGSDWADFTSWCASVGAGPLPASAATVAMYLTARADTLAVSTLARRLAAIAAAHRENDEPVPASSRLSKVWAGIRRTHGRPPAKKRALRTDDLIRVVKALPANVAGSRDRAILLLGFASALRREELASLQLAGPGVSPAAVTVSFVDHGVEICVGRAKGDQEGHGETLAVPFGRKAASCPVGALRAWLKVSAIAAGPVFRPVDRHGRIATRAMSGKAVADVVKRAAERFGLDPEGFAGHSLRRGLITSAAAGGASPEALMKHARHARFETTRGYIEDADRMKNSAAGKAGL